MKTNIKKLPEIRKFFNLSCNALEAVLFKESREKWWWINKGSIGIIDNHSDIKGCIISFSSNIRPIRNKIGCVPIETSVNIETIRYKNTITPDWPHKCHIDSSNIRNILVYDDIPIFDNPCETRGFVGIADIFIDNQISILYNHGLYPDKINIAIDRNISIFEYTNRFGITESGWFRVNVSREDDAARYGWTRSIEGWSGDFPHFCDPSGCDTLREGIIGDAPCGAWESSGWIRIYRAGREIPILKIVHEIIHNRVHAISDRLCQKRISSGSVGDERFGNAYIERRCQILETRIESIGSGRTRITIRDSRITDEGIRAPTEILKFISIK